MLLHLRGHGPIAAEVTSMQFEPRRDSRIFLRLRHWLATGKIWLCRAYRWAIEQLNTTVRLFQRLPPFWQRVILWLLKLIIEWLICWWLSKLI